MPRPRTHLTRYHGVFTPHGRWRAEVTRAGRGKPTATDLRTEAERHRAMTSAQRRKRVFRIEIETCEQCLGKGRVTAVGTGPPAGSFARLGTKVKLPGPSWPTCEPRPLH